MQNIKSGNLDNVIVTLSNHIYRRSQKNNIMDDIMDLLVEAKEKIKLANKEDVAEDAIAELAQVFLKAREAGKNKDNPDEMDI